MNNLFDLKTNHFSKLVKYVVSTLFSYVVLRRRTSFHFDVGSTLIRILDNRSSDVVRRHSTSFQRRNDYLFLLGAEPVLIKNF